MRLPRKPSLWMMKQVKRIGVGEGGWWKGSKCTTWITFCGYLGLDGKV